MNNEEILSKVREFAYRNSDKGDIHGFNHVLRVYNMCINLGKKTFLNLFLLKIAALLHDIGRIDERKLKNKKNHADLSAEKAQEFLMTQPFDFSQNDVEVIINCIRAHSFSNNVAPLTIEAKVLSDADKLDAIGAIGIFRTIGFTLENGGGIEQVIEHLESKILNLKDKLFLDASKKIAENRHKTVLDFYNKLKKEKI